MNTTEEKEFRIDIDTLFPEFNNHLNIHQNSRIFLSGQFGIGKTYFLKEFFANREKCEVFHLSPVQYQISSNEDIINFLKYDILIELINKGNVFDNKNDLDKSFMAFIKKERNSNSFIKGLIENTVELLPGDLGKLGKPLKTILSIDKEFQEFQKDGNEKIIKDFLEGHNSEPDIISEIIKSKIESYEESILILDDLDRIDPEHIFRILNVFSTHFNLCSNPSDNKFGFNKVILVGDIHNIKSIFHHRYGNSADFNGYFNKFFSVEVFQLENKKIIKSIIKLIIENFPGEHKNLFKDSLGKSGYLQMFLEDILLKSIHLKGTNRLTLRQLLKPIHYPLDIFKSDPDNHRSSQQDPYMLGFINFGIKVLITIFGGLAKSLVETLEEIRKECEKSLNNEGYPPYKSFSQYLLRKIKAFDSKAENVSLQHLGYNITLKKGEIYSIEDKTSSQINPECLFFDLLIEYIKKEHYLL